MTHVNVFTAGVGGYASYRIPSISEASDGTLVAVAEGRLSSSADPGGTHIDLLASRSTDGGKTWSTPVVIDRNPATGSNLSTDKTSACNPVSLYDPASNRLWVFDLRLPNGVSAASAGASTGEMQTWGRYSTDGGLSWSSAAQITSSYANFYPNIGSGIVTASGRLIVPATTYPTKTGATQSFVLYSDDHGTTWTAGGLIGTGTNEEHIVQLANGNLLSSARQNSGSYKIQSISTDGGATWGAPSNGPAVTTVATGLVRYSQAGVGGATQNQILMSYPAGISTNSRADLTISSSYNEGTSFSNNNVIYRGSAAYSDMVNLGSGQVGVLWERGNNEGTTNYQQITYTTLNNSVLNPSTATGLLASDSFNYTTATVGTAIGGNGWNSTWASASSLAGSSTAAVVQTGLTRAGLSYTPTGGAVALQGTSMSRGIATSLDLTSDRTFYISMLVDRSSTTGTNAQGLDVEFLDASGNEQLGFGATASGNQWYINAFGDETDTTNGPLTSSSTYLLVAKVVAGPSSDQLYFKAFAPSDALPATDDGLDWTLSSTAGQSSSAVLGALFFQAGSNAQWLTDEVRVGTTWASTVAVPEPGMVWPGIIILASIPISRRRFRHLSHC